MQNDRLVDKFQESIFFLFLFPPVLQSNSKSTDILGSRTEKVGISHNSDTIWK